MSEKVLCEWESVAQTLQSPAVKERYNAIQYNAIQYNAMRYNAMRCNAIQYNAMSEVPNKEERKYQLCEFL